MRYATDFNDYEVIDTCDGEKLERWGDIILIRPDPQILWKGQRHSPLWDNAHARYMRATTGGGHWEYYKKLPDDWQIKYRELTFLVRPTGFKHTGLFPEQSVNWQLLMDAVRSAGRPVRALNLFGYTGAATAALAAAGASVCHVDASKGMTAWAKDNARLSGLQDAPIRWIVDDCAKFVQREIKRGNRYDILLMDPPSYGRGPGGEIWKLEDSIYDLVALCTQVLSDDPLLFLLSSYTTGLGAGVMEYLLRECVGERFGGTVRGEEIGVAVTATGGILPCGNTAVWQKKD